MLHAKFQDHPTSGSEEVKRLKGFYIWAWAHGIHPYCIDLAIIGTPHL